MKESNNFSILIESNIHIDFDVLHEELKDISTLIFKYGYRNDLIKQYCEFQGKIDEKEIERVACKMIPQLKDLLGNFYPYWKKNTTVMSRRLSRVSRITLPLTMIICKKKDKGY